jgi:hypothetical protein
MTAVDEPNLKVKVALGLVPGWRELRKFGMNDAVVSSSTQEMWPLGTARVWPTSAAVAIAASSDAADDGNPVGTGARTIIIEGLDANYEEVSETLTMEGLSNATTTQTFLRINRAYVQYAGSNGINVGNITITVGGNPQAYIEANEGQTQQTHYTVPAGHTWIIQDYHIAVGRMSGSTDLHVMGQIRLYDEAGLNNYQSWRSVSDIYLWNGGGWDNFAGATVVPQKTDVRQVIVSSTTTQANSVVEGYLIKNDRFDT